MVHLYLATALLFAMFASACNNTFQTNLLLRFPAIVGAIIYGILAAKGFNLI